MQTDLLDFIRNLTETRFYGTVTLKYEAGKVVYLRKEETIKPPYRDNRGSNDDRNHY